MDFFGHQEEARRNTAWLVGLFAAAVVLIVLAVYLAITAGLWFGQFFQGTHTFFTVETLWDAPRFFWTCGITVAVIAAGSWYRTAQLRHGGGAAVAEMLGGERIPASTDDPLLRRLLNIVEEMAIASGLPVPPVYLLQQSGINAFAAGFSPSDAVVAVTNGAVELLNRDELQGVIAHEFSHLLNGDSRLKMRLMGLLFGITLISDAGIALMTARASLRYGVRRQERGTHPAMLVLGGLLFMVGTVGAVFADMIKRAVSRQREFLADAAAVQFTRNPGGIANALKVIGGYKEGSRVRHAAAQQASHFFFGNALSLGGGKDWWATHPPLIDRIKRLDPAFRGKFETVNAASRTARIANEAWAGFAGGEAAIQAAVADAKTVMHDIGTPNAAHLYRARQLIKAIPDRLKHFAHDPYTARAVIYALLLDPDEAKARAMQLEVLKRSADASVFRELLEIQPLAAKLAPELRLPLVEMVLPTLKTLSPEQYKVFHQCVVATIKADHKVSMREYVLHRMLLRHLRPAFYPVAPQPVQFDRIGEVAGDAACLLASLIRADQHESPAEVYAAASALLATDGFPPMPEPKDCRLTHLDAALHRLARASHDIKRQVLEACVTCVLSNGRIAVKEGELLRIIADALDCPMPPLQVSS